MKEIMHNGYKEFLVSFDEFKEVLKPENKMKLAEKTGSANHNFIYRGQSNSTHELVPSLYRNVFAHSTLSNSYNDLCFLQLTYLKTFVKGCDINAVSIPNDSYIFRTETLNECHDKVFLNPSSWPQRQLFELLAFAQHYGYPTELLDWSYNPLVAMYFAATGVINGSSNLEDSFSIWVIDTEKKNLLNSSDKLNFEIIDVPRAHNINISSQEGCFTLVRQTLDARANLTHQSFKITELKLISDLMHERQVSDLFKFTIKNSEVLKVLEFCEDYSINAAKLFRGPYGAAKYATESISAAKFASKHNLQIRGCIPI
ncbi:FRG domain-containing protein [Acinetobacter baumannii]|uniref:FRG domain-containing protein n=1 Tax=Acinetobacter baumannii TaxID=470 RepID=UPI002AFFBA9D|nr:FRG domain-containing protein [Acinetobacter baumannii]MEA1815944.1 FRG domain-containing protein [Acinetobacter baumannii]